MLTLLIAVQQAVPRQVLGTATSLNQFSRSIGGAVGVAVMGAFLSAGLGSHLHQAANQPDAMISTEEASQLAENPNALIEPTARATLPVSTLNLLQQSLSEALGDVFHHAADVLLGSPDPHRLDRAARWGLHDPGFRSTALDLVEIALAGCRQLGPGYLDPSDLEQAAAFFDQYTRGGRALADDVLEDAVAA